MVIADLIHRTDPAAHSGVVELADVVGACMGTPAELSRPSVERAVAELRDAGLLTSRRTGRGSVFELQTPGNIGPERPIIHDMSRAMYRDSRGGYSAPADTSPATQHDLTDPRRDASPARVRTHQPRRNDVSEPSPATHRRAEGGVGGGVSRFTSAFSPSAAAPQGAPARSVAGDGTAAAADALRGGGGEEAADGPAFVPAGSADDPARGDVAAGVLAELIAWGLSSGKAAALVAKYGGDRCMRNVAEWQRDREAAKRGKRPEPGPGVLARMIDADECEARKRARGARAGVAGVTTAGALSALQQAARAWWLALSLAERRRVSAWCVAQADAMPGRGREVAERLRRDFAPDGDAPMERAFERTAPRSWITTAFQKLGNGASGASARGGEGAGGHESTGGAVGHQAAEAAGV